MSSKKANYETMNRRARLRRYDGDTTRQLNRIYHRDQRICQLCFKYCERTDATRDHIKRFSECTPEEARSDANVRLAHYWCNENRHIESLHPIEPGKREPKSPIRTLTQQVGELFPGLGKLYEHTSES